MIPWRRHWLIVTLTLANLDQTIVQLRPVYSQILGYYSLLYIFISQTSSLFSFSRMIPTYRPTHLMVILAVLQQLLALNFPRTKLQCS